MTDSFPFLEPLARSLRIGADADAGEDASI
jgi:hypothetical protein